MTNLDASPTTSAGAVAPVRNGALTLGHVLGACGFADLGDVLIIRHTYKEDGLRTAKDLTPEKVLSYTRRQVPGSTKFPKIPPKHWLLFMADGGHRSRLLWAYENHGESVEPGPEGWRYFDLRPSEVAESLHSRLVVEWSKDSINWAKSGPKAAQFPVIEIADPEVVPFPGFDRVVVTYETLQAVTTDARYAAWRTALGSVQGIYLIADTKTGQLYVGKADGRERILGRWSTYARDGHGGNVAMLERAGLDPSHAEQFVFSILRVFGPAAIGTEVDEAEAHYKRSLLTREFGLNRN